ncbi:hypothetical protein, partial [Enterobacter cloacae complex sp. 2DZ2F20B]|uniref:hypothetical protein n=1 Tax=Enterobacter cloacae complex sp. 2DZ2F20B TaxID=2511993 RepID=UPI0010267CD4
MIELKEKETLINTNNQTKIFFGPVDINEYAVYLFASLRDDTYQSILTQQFQVNSKTDNTNLRTIFLGGTNQKGYTLYPRPAKQKRQ